ncbi:dihydrodipicolinate synthase/N-acetylneuraminate lyase [Bosea sp. OAE506]
MTEPYKGILPIAPTIFHDNGDVDLDGNRRVMDLMVDQGVDGICILANFSEQFLLTDAEREQVMHLSLEQVAGRVPVIVTTSHFSTRIAAQRAKAAADAGAKMLMMMPPYHGALLKADEQGMVEHFKQVADACGIPIILQDAPLSGVTLTVPFMIRLAERGAARPLLQDRGARHGQQAACADRGWRRCSGGPLRRRGGDHADGRS